MDKKPANNANISDLSMDTIALSSESEDECALTKIPSEKTSIIEYAENPSKAKYLNTCQDYLQKTYGITESHLKSASNHASSPSALSIDRLNSNCSINSQVIPDWASKRCSSVFDDLLFEIYDRWHYGGPDLLDSDTLTDVTESDIVFTKMDTTTTSESSAEHKRKNCSLNLLKKDIDTLTQMVNDLTHQSNQMSSTLIRQLKRRDKYLSVLREKCDIVTAILHASSLKRREDSRIRFSIEPSSGDDAFLQWLDAMKAVIRLPKGIPIEFRRKVWLALADHYISSLSIDWEKTKKFVFNEKTNPDDNTLGLQIVKDLHRTGCNSFNGTNSDEDRAILKRVLLAYARWNKKVGYCQGFNIIAAFILDVVDRKEDEALKMMIYLIEYVLPESYFADNLRSLSVDMAVFREVLRISCPRLSKHLDYLRTAARDKNTGVNYEPPLTNVFIMQWFLTLFATCLPKSTALRVWDSILIDGSEILLRTAVAIWTFFQKRILSIESADEFYSSMEIFSHELLEGKKLNDDSLIRNIYNVSSFPRPQLDELREKLAYNITPFSAAMMASVNNQKKGLKGVEVNNRGQPGEEEDEDDSIENINCFGGLFPLSIGQQHVSNCLNKDASSSDMSQVSPGAYNAHPETINVASALFSDRVSLDINMLHKQYLKLRQRQKQAHLILSSARNKQKTCDEQINMTPLFLNILGDSTNLAENHLFMARDLMKTYNSTAVPCDPITSGLQTVPVHPRPPLRSESISSFGPVSINSSSEATVGHISEWSDTDGDISVDNIMNISKENTELNTYNNVDNIDLTTSQNMQYSQNCKDLKNCDILVPVVNKVCTTVNDNFGDTYFNSSNDNVIKLNINNSLQIQNISNKEIIKNKIDKNLSFLEINDSQKKGLHHPTNDYVMDLEKSSMISHSNCEIKVTNKAYHKNKTVERTNQDFRRSTVPAIPLSSNEQFIPSKKYNHFSRRISCTRMMQKGLKLGLYSAESIDQFNRKMSFADNNNEEEDIPHKTYHNACLHRQYLVSINPSKKL